MNPIDIDEQEGFITFQTAPEVEIKFTGSHIEPYIPEYHSEKAAGFDLKADVPENGIVVLAGQTKIIPTGLNFGLPEGYELQIRSRSGLAAKNNVFVLNSPGTIDEDYHGEVMIILTNLSDFPFTVEKGMRVAQAVLTPYVQGSLTPVEAFSVTTNRGIKGLGSSGY